MAGDSQAAPGVAVAASNSPGGSNVHAPTDIARTDEPARSSARALIVLCRPHQWVKNAFVLAPILFSPHLLAPELLLRALIGFLCFCAISSTVYIVNDYMDRATDRLHPEKRSRPLAAGTVTTTDAMLTAGFLAAGAAVVASYLDPAFCLILIAYFGLNLAYSLKLKRISILDVMIVAFGFILRIEGGAQLVHIDPSVWIVVCTGLIALFIAIAKRRDDIVHKLGTDHRNALAGYSRIYLDVCMTMILGALLVSYIIYCTDIAVMARMGTEHLYFTVPFVIAGVMRYLQIALVEQQSGSPTRIIVTDRFMLSAILGWLATFLALIHL